MSQNLIPLALTAEQLTAIERALATLEQNMRGRLRCSRHSAGR